MKAIFLDRDGTVILDKNYQYKPEEIEYFADTFSALKIIQDKGYEIFLITNQSGVGRGIFTMDDVHKMHSKLSSDLKKNHLKDFIDIQVAPEHPDNPGRRKPNPIMITECIEKYNVDKDLSWMLGDKIIDAEAGKAAGINGGIVYKEQDSPYPFFKNLLEFAESI